MTTLSQRIQIYPSCSFQSFYRYYFHFFVSMLPLFLFDICLCCTVFLIRRTQLLFKHFYSLSNFNEIRSPPYLNFSDVQCHNCNMKLSFKYCCLYINHVIVIFLRLVRYLNNNEILFTNVVIDYSHPAKIKSLYDAAQFHNI